MSDVKISDMTPWVGAIPGAAILPIVYLGVNYRMTISQMGATGTFVSADSKTVTVVNGLITSIA